MKKTFGRTGSWIDADFDDDFVSFSNSSPAPVATANVSIAKNENKNSSFFKKRKVDIPTRITFDKDVQLWIDRHQPKKISDLAVHPKKIEEIRFWFNQNVASPTGSPVKKEGGRGILLLTGPPGCGKTATVRAISADLRVLIQEWSTPNDLVDFVPRTDPFYDFNQDDLPYVSQSNAFRTFMLRANRYKVLNGLLESSDPFQDSNSKIVLIEDLPTFAFRKKEEFQDILFQYHRSSRSFPLVIIQSESSKDDSLKKIFPPDFIQQLKIHQIQMNSIATTNLVKALTSISSYESVNGVRRFTLPDKTALTALATSAAGDIRGAINALQFACLNDVKGDFVTSFEGQTSLGPSSKKKKPQPGAKSKNKSDDPAQASIGGKDNCLDLFHGMGKVLYCKREEDEMTSDKKLLPKHMLHRARRKLLINPEELLDTIPMEASSFVTFLHQNYPDFFSCIKALSTAAEYVSMSDHFFHEWTSTGKINLCDYGGSLAVRGLCHSNTKVKPNLGMKNFCKPDWFAAIKKSRSRQNSLTQLSQTRGLGSNEMASVFLPYLAKCYGSCLPKEVSEIGLFPGSEPLKVSQSDIVLFSAVPQEQEVPDDAKEDFLIEDFD